MREIRRINQCPNMCGGGNGGALVAIRDAFARWRMTESLWKKCRVTPAARSEDL